jgi:hypothetical protein
MVDVMVRVEPVRREWAEALAEGSLSAPAITTRPLM